MNPVIETIHERRSVRSYKPNPIPKDVLQTLVEAGHQAPARGLTKTAGESFSHQPWRFVVVQDATLRKNLAEVANPLWAEMMAGMQETHPETYKSLMTEYEATNGKKDMVFYAAPVIIFVIGPMGYEISCSLACENVMIAATSLGLGSCYVGFGATVVGIDAVAETLGVKDGERVFGPIVVGYPSPESAAEPAPDRGKPDVRFI